MKTQRVFTIEDVAQLHSITKIREKNGEVFAICPFCGDKRGKFSYVTAKGRKKNIYNCFNCDSHGSGVELHMKLSPTKDFSGENGYKNAMRDIANGLDNYTGEIPTTHVPAVNEAEKASKDVCSAVYYQMLSLLTLKEAHRSDLQRRGLTDADIRRFRFRSTPEDMRARQTVVKSLYKKMTAMGISLKGVPGFYRNQKGYWDMKLPGAGYFCPVFEGNLIIGMQIRLEEPKGSNKYMWFSSSGKECGVSSGSPATTLTGENANCVIITEGILKATVTYVLLGGTITVIGVPGIKATSSLNQMLSTYQNLYVFEAFDMDKMHRAEQGPVFEKATRLVRQKVAPSFTELCNRAEYREEFHDILSVYRISEAATALREKITEFGFAVHALTWDTANGFWNGNYKGIDDFLLAYPKREKVIDYMLRKVNAHTQLLSFLSQKAAE